MNHDQWKTDMMDAVTAVYKARGLTTFGAGQLRASVLAPRDPDRMKDDTIFRTNGKAGGEQVDTTSSYEFPALAGAFNRVKEEGRVWSRFSEQGRKQG